jgi:hypothetical protein
MKAFARRIFIAVPIALILTIALPLPGAAKAAPDGINWAAYQDMAVDLMRDIRVPAGPRQHHCTLEGLGRQAAFHPA